MTEPPRSPNPRRTPSSSGSPSDAELAATEAAVARAEKQLRRSAMTTLSRDARWRSPSPAGRADRLKFLDGKYRSMSAPQLAAAVLDAAIEGRQRMAVR